MSGPRQIGPGGMTAFVPNGDSRRDTAIILIGTAQEHGLDDARAVRAAQGGFYISDELADLLYDEPEQAEPEQTEQDETEVSRNTETEDEPEQEPEAKPKARKTTAKKSSPKKASGNRAAKNATNKEQ